MPTREESLKELERLRMMDELRELRLSSPPAPIEPSLAEQAGEGALTAAKGLKEFAVGGPGSIAENIPVIGPLGRMAGEGFRAAIEGGISSQETIPQAYQRIHQQNEQARQAYAQQNPNVAMAQKAAGALGAGALPILGVGVRGAVGAGARLASSAGLGAAEEALQGGDARQGATVAGGMQAGLEAVAPASKALRPITGPMARALTRTGQALQDTAAVRGVKHALGNVKKAWDALGDKRVVPTGTEALESGMIRFGEKAGKTAARAKAAGEESWAKVEDIYERAEEAGVKVQGKEIANRILDKAAKIKDVPKNRTRIEQLQDEALYFEEQGAISIRDAQNYKNEYDWKAVDKLKDALGKNGNNLMDRAIGDTIKETVQKSGVKGAEQFPDLYKRYGVSKTIQKGAEETEQRLTKNRGPFSLTDYIAGGAGAGVGAIVSGNPKDAFTFAAVTAAANNLARTRGNSAIAATLFKVGEKMKRSPEFTAKYRDILTRAAERGTDSLAATHMILMRQDPEYAQGGGQ